MERFPKLSTGAAAQYGAQRTLRLQTAAHRFLDTSEQRYRYSAEGQRSWRLAFDNLSAGEAAEIREFFVRMRGSQTEFELEDPWSGTVVGPCRFTHDELVERASDERSESLTVVVRES